MSAGGEAEPATAERSYIEKRHAMPEEMVQDSPFAATVGEYGEIGRMRRLPAHAAAQRGRSLQSAQE